MDHNTPHIQQSEQQARLSLLIPAQDRVPHPSRLCEGWGNRVSDPLSFPRTFLLTLAILLTATLPAKAQWDIQESHTTASLRGIHNVGGGVAWASGTEGTVLRTEDGGHLWQGCATPPGAEKLDFRGIQAFDENTAIVMSSGKGDLSRLYKTTDGCRTWKLLFTNPDKEGFWDALQFTSQGSGYLLGDPVDGKFVIFHSSDSGASWKQLTDTGLKSFASDGAFAASNSSLVVVGQSPYFGTGGSTGGHLYRQDPCSHSGPCLLATATWSRHAVPVGIGPQNAGIFSVAGRRVTDTSGRSQWLLVAVGGDYTKPADTSSTAASSFDDGANWTPALSPPHGYRSAVAYDPTTKTWITVGPNGTDISRDDGRNWSPLKPTATEPQDADKNWNALSLPFVVGPKGRIGKLRNNAIPTAASSKEEKDKKD